MKKVVLFIALIAANLGTHAVAANFTACQGTYALCTTAKCAPVTGKDDVVSCQCDVKTGYSAAANACEPVKQTNAGKMIYSRYYPIKDYVVCSNQRPWAWCLDKPCVINEHNPSKAACACSVVRDKGQYIIVTNRYTKTTCTTDLYSSATVDNVTQINDFLKTQSEIKPYPIKVINPS